MMEYLARGFHFIEMRKWKRLPRKVILRHFQAPGDVICMTAAVRDLKSCYGERIQVDVRTAFPEVFFHNPYLTPIYSEDPDAIAIDIHHMVHESTRSIRPGSFHLMTGFYHSVNRALGTNISPLIGKPDLHLAPDEKEINPYPFPYWVICAGGKADMTVKHWSRRRYSELASALHQNGIKLIQIGDTASGHEHAELPYCENLLGQTTLRDVFRLVCHARGVIGHISMLHHIAAAFDKPSVVIAGGREDRFLYDYSPGQQNFGRKISLWVTAPQEVLTSVGAIECASTRGCYKNVTTSSEERSDLCKNTLNESGQILAKCMDRISLDQVVESVIRADKKYSAIQGAFGITNSKTPARNFRDHGISASIS